MDAVRLSLDPDPLVKLYFELRQGSRSRSLSRSSKPHPVPRAHQSDYEDRYVQTRTPGRAEDPYHTRSIFPPVLRPVYRQKVLNLPLLHMPRHPLLMAASCVHRKPPSLRIERRINWLFAHGFAILTWWGIFPHPLPRNTKHFQIPSPKTGTNPQNGRHWRDTSTGRALAFPISFGGLAGNKCCRCFQFGEERFLLLG